VGNASGGKALPLVDGYRKFPGRWCGARDLDATMESAAREAALMPVQDRDPAHLPLWSLKAGEDRERKRSMQRMRSDRRMMAALRGEMMP